MSKCGTLNLISSECLQVDIGFDYILDNTYTDNGDSPIDLTGASFIMDITDKDDTLILQLLTVGTQFLTGIYITDAANGKYQIVIRDTENSSIPAGGYLYELTFISSGGLKSKFMKGSIEFSNG